MRAPAKVNLHLSVGHVREDGFHELTTVFQAIGLYDDVTLSRAEEPAITVGGPASRADRDSVPLDASNLALRAVALLAEHTGNHAAVAVHIRKGIPVAGGCARPASTRRPGERSSPSGTSPGWPPPPERHRLSATA